MDKLNDCYFYYYSTCTKGKRCPFRHCDLALGSEVVCELWRIGRCKDRNCPFRHMEPNINRAGTSCWFETQPQGCRKPHCVFQHSKPRPPLNEHIHIGGQDLILPTSVKLQNGDQSSVGGAPSELKLLTESKISQKSAINISIEREDEESDDQDNNDEVKKNSADENEIQVKTLEQIRMEKILNSSPADNEGIDNEEEVDDDTTGEAENQSKEYRSIDNRNLLRRQIRSSNDSSQTPSSSSQEEKIADSFVVKSLAQIRKERNESDKSNDEVENLTPNLLMKRSFDYDGEDCEDDVKSSNSRPIKIRRNRLCAPSSNALQGEKTSNGYQPDCDSLDEKKSTSPELSLCSNISGRLAALSEKDSNSASVDLDFDEFDFDDDLPSNGNGHRNIDVNLEDDELMREIDQVINS